MNISSVNTIAEKSNIGVSMKDVGILVLGHGSTLPYNRELVEEMAQLIARRHPGPVKTAYLNANQPHIPEGLQSFAGTNVKRIVALPLFLAHGVHTKEDIPRELGVDGKSRKGLVNIEGRGVEVFCAEPLGMDECIAALAYKRAEEALR
ncbi:MAG: sirohydrochlorin nickelochelatase [Methanotrichaceae archaeon]|jgi:sirohydrochlorin cobaltochelatase